MLKWTINDRWFKTLARLTALLGVFAFPTVGLALGLGPIQVKSFLNQPLKAEVMLIQAAGEDVTAAEASVASQAAFERVGLSRNAATNNMRFRIVGNGSSGKPARLLITTTDVVKEPVLSFLVRLDWPSGAVVREYTILLDPPVTQATEAAMARQEPPVAKAMPLPGRAKPKPAPRPVLSPVPPRPQTAARPAPAPRSAPAEKSTPGKYGPVKPRETLWSIAYKLRSDPRRITMDQMQIAILRANPTAFENGNINKLIKGSILDIPAASQIAAINPNAARAEVASQRAAYRQQAPQNRIASAAGPEEVDTADFSAAASGVAKESAESADADEPEVDEDATAEEPSEAPDNAGAEEAVAEDAGAVGAPAVDAEKAEDMEDAELDAEAQRALAVMREQAESDSVATEAEAEAGSVAGSDVVDAEAALDAESIFGEGTEVDDAEPGVDDVEADAVAEGVAEEDSTIAWQGEAPPGGGLLSPLNIAGAVGILALLAGALWYNRKRRNKEAEEDFTAAMQQQSEAADAGGVATEGGLEVTEAEPVAPATTDSGGDSGVPDVGSPEEVLSEVDMHLAYGLHEECENMLNAAISANPDRQDLKVKLLEVYGASGKADAYEELAGSLKDSLGEDDPQWVRIAETGRKLLPASAMFGVAAAASETGSDVGDDVAAEQADTTQADAPEETVESELEQMLGDSSGTEDAGEESFDFDDLSKSLEAEETEEAPTESPEAPPQDDAAGLEFNMDDLDFGIDDPDSEAAVEDVKDTESTEPESAAAAPDSGGGLDFDIGDLESPAEETDTQGATEPEQSEDGADDPGAISFDEAATDDAEDEAAGKPEPDLSDLPEELEEADATPDEFDALADAALAGGANEVPAEEEPAEAPESADGGEDEMATKLDLARAYIDMGEPGMAESLLQEVISGGSDAQRSEAEELLKSNS